MCIRDRLYIKASNSDRQDQFGHVAVHGETIVVGATWEESSAQGIDGDQLDNNSDISGAVYVLR